jgi:F0F1-type ATP synthase membrane subunit b/b'
MADIETLKRELEQLIEKLRAEYTRAFIVSIDQRGRIPEHIREQPLRRLEKRIRDAEGELWHAKRGTPWGGPSTARG